MPAPRCPECNSLLPQSGPVNFCPGCGLLLAGGAARPLAPAQKSAWTEFLDQAWDFFASTRVATVLLLIIAAAAIGGSMVEQENLYQDWRPPELYYPYRYGEVWGPWLMRLGLTHAYTSVWFVSLIYLCVVSLVVCSLQRLAPLYRALRRPTVKKHLGFISRQPTFGTYPPPADGDALAPLVALLQKRGYRMIRDGNGLHADRGQWGRYGPYIIHIGLIICALAATAKILPSWDITHDLWVPQGQTMVIPGTDLALRNDKFTIEMHPDGSPQTYRTDAVLLAGGEEVAAHSIEVNHPLKYKGWEFYQAAFRPEPGTVHLAVVDAASGTPVGRVAADLKTPSSGWALPGGLTAVVEEYYPDASIDEAAGTIVNRSRDITNPLFFLHFLDAAGTQVGAQALWVSLEPGRTMPVVGTGPVRLEQIEVETRWYSGIKVHHDRTIPYMFGGLGVVMLGMWMTYTIFHRQIWALHSGAEVLVGARTNRDRWGQERELRRWLESLDGQLKTGYTVTDDPAP